MVVISAIMPRIKRWLNEIPNDANECPDLLLEPSCQTFVVVLLYCKHDS
jgi:hypothetical protein